MLPSILAKQLQKGIGDYIETTFPMTNEPFKGSLKSMLNTADSVFHEPYVAVRLPFRVASKMPDYFESIHPPYIPYVHQERAFERLNGEDGRSTLIATGTGSGKTECFLYPILEYCYQHRGEKGIKALIIYPMNALASDQAKRISEIIYKSPELRGNVTVGMYVGGKEESPARMMGEYNVITDRETLRSNPPDILMTNYKMLDYLLVRPKDSILWQDNSRYTLKYIAVDEFHTFDGAQGTDLACLLRRLKRRLDIENGYLCCVGTSATMGNKDNEKTIIDYASEVFGERFEADSVITEDRLTPEEYFESCSITEFDLPNQLNMSELSTLVSNDDEENYLKAAVKFWFENYTDDVLSDEGRVKLGELLMHHSFVQSVISLTGGRYCQAKYIVEELKSNYPVLNEIQETDNLVYSLFALISHARTKDNGKLRPFLFVQVQLWMRELRRLVAKVDNENVVYSIAHDLNHEQSKHYLPIVNCRECGVTGWATKLNEHLSASLHGLEGFYNMYFRGDESIAMMFPFEDKEPKKGMMPAKLCPNCMKVNLENKDYCPSCGNDVISVQIPNPIKTSGSKDSKQYICPCCESRRGLSLMGLRSATEISATISQLFASRFNDDKKTLAFSDNVQDAAHRAGFFNSRTWRFGLRTAMQSYVLNGGNGLSLNDFSEGFISYWHGKLSNEEFVSKFIAPNMTWMRAYEEMKENRKLTLDEYGKSLIGRIERRLKYEIMLEYGMTARIGRTLEKSACSMLVYDLLAIDKVAAVVQERVINELGIMTTSDIKVFKQMVIGYLDIMRINGAFDDEAFYLMVEKCNGYLLSNDYIKWMPGRQSGRNTPRLVTDTIIKGRGHNMYDAASANKYYEWIRFCSGELFVEENDFKKICCYILSELVADGLVNQIPFDGDYKVFGLNKNRVFVTRDVTQMRCDECGGVYSVATESVAYWKDAPCPNITCSGILKIDNNENIGYYSNLYSSGDFVRVNAKEHTGLLDRDDREQLELDFKRKKNADKTEELQLPWDPNVLSCTPTLEMGIDIGDLSTVILCSMPPAQAQFLQRAGRAGRKDGNALTLAVANAKPHDLYFYADPLDMIEGNVQAPKIFLKASAVLERQFVAYCMDTWVKSGIDEQAIPRKMDAILSKLDSHLTEDFPFNFLNYIQDNLTDLLNSFLAMFSTDLDSVTKSELRKFAQGDKLSDSPMHIRILDSFQNLKKQLDSLKKSIQDLDSMIKELESKPKDSSYDEQIKELKSEQKALRNVYREIRNKDVFNFISDEGLLPNYAFPETGIVLKAVLYRKEEKNSNDDENATKNKYDKMVYEYSRGAASAISEFAPMNSFYADGRKFTINQVDLTTAQAAKWRLCPNCSFAQIEEIGKNAAACPRCGSPAWTDNGQVRTMLKVQMVYSNMDYTKNLIGDESDDRNNIFYTRQLLVDVDEDHDIISAYQMNNDEFPFGYEFVKKATLREINFGESDLNGEHLQVSGVDEVRKGFKICKHCGYIQSDKDPRKHGFFCKTKNNPTLATNNIEDCLFLYREFQTEVLRLLIPATTMDTTLVRTESFVAAFMLGMKEHFGNVDHLRATVSEVPVPDADYRKQYLVIYDSVPGGTGYLKQLLHEKDALIKVFEKALAVLENCSCKEDNQKDGCYHCLFTYRQNQNIGNISRYAAIRILKAILSGKDNIEKIERLGNVSVNPLFDSELERRFIEALNYLGNAERKITVSKALINNKEGYILKVNDYTWEIEPQVLLDSEQGVPVKCKPDFVLWPISAKGRKPVAVFTDGFQYHKDKVFDDTLKRIAISKSNNFRVWSLSYRDVQNVFQSQGDFATKTLDAMSMPSGPKVYKPTISSAKADAISPSELNAYDLLMYYLGNENAENVLSTHARAYSLSLLNNSLITNALAYVDWEVMIKSANKDIHFTLETYEQGKTLFGTWSPRKENNHFAVFAGISLETVKKDKNAPIAVCALLDDDLSSRTDKYEAEWNGFWHFTNVMQFNSAFAPVSKVGLEMGTYLSLPVFEVDEVFTSDESGKWSDIYEMVYDEALDFSEKLAEAGVLVPDEVGFELTDDTGEVLGMAEMAWITSKIVYLTEDEMSDSKVFEKNGWLVITSATDITSIDFGGDEE